MPPVSKQEIKRMSNIVTHEVSLVRRAANKKRFAVTKSDRSNTMDPMIEAVASTVAEGEEQFIATMKAKGIVDAKKLAALVANYRITKNFSDLVTEEELEEVQKAAGYKKAAKKLHKIAEDMKKTADGMMDEDEEDEDDMYKGKKTKKSDGELDLSVIVEAVAGKLAETFKVREAEMVKKHDQLAGIVGELLSEDRKQYFTAKAAKDLRRVPAGTEEIAMTLKSAYDADPKLGESIENLLLRVNEALVSSPVLKSFGSTGARAGGSGDAWGKIQALAGQMVQKSGDAKFTSEKAVALVLKTEEGRRLYDEYLHENPAQRARNAGER
jgi:hypothetical protein